MVDYVSLAATALRLIDTNGRDVTLTKKDRTPANAAQPWRGPGVADTTVVVKAVVFPFDAEDIDGELVRREDKRAFVSASAAGVNEVEDFDFLTDGSDIFKIQRVRVIAPGDTRVLYDIQLRA